MRLSLPGKCLIHSPAEAFFPSGAAGQVGGRHKEITLFLDGVRLPHLPPADQAVP